MNVIEAVNLTKYYGKNMGIENLNLTVSEGEFFGVIGPNGAGKSTTIRTLLGLINKSSGEAKIFGKDIKKYKKEILSDIGYMPSEANFYSGMRVGDIISLSAQMRKIDCHKEAELLCERLELNTEKKVDELSLGNRKKVAIVCAMQHKPSLYILDEPTSGLDPLMQKEFFEILKERHSAGATIFLSSHVLSEIQKNCLRAAIIKNGTVVALDKVENLSKTGAKRITLHGITSIPETLLVQSAEVGEDYVTFLYCDDIKQLLTTAANMPIKDITIVEPDLDEIFMYYYERDGKSE